MVKNDLDPTTQLWNPLIMRVLNKAVEFHKAFLFGITGDIDNLGLYVARNGRARAENLVDLYNQFIRREFTHWCTLHEDIIVDYAYVASGEEMLMMGLATSRPRVEGLFHDLSLRLNRIIRHNQHIDPEETSISFGCSILQDTSLDESIKRLTDEIGSASDSHTFNRYLMVMESIRECLARELDKAKFSSLGKLAIGNEILLRNIAYAHVIEYKHGTAKSLKTLVEHLSGLVSEHDVDSLNNVYGLDDTRRRVAFGVKHATTILTVKEQRP